MSCLLKELSLASSGGTGCLGGRQLIISVQSQRLNPCLLSLGNTFRIFADGNCCPSPRGHLQILLFKLTHGPKICYERAGDNDLQLVFGFCYKVFVIEQFAELWRTQQNCQDAAQRKWPQFFEKCSQKAFFESRGKPWRCKRVLSEVRNWMGGMGWRRLIFNFTTAWNLVFTLQFSLSSICACVQVNQMNFELSYRSCWITLSTFSSSQAVIRYCEHVLDLID